LLVLDDLHDLPDAARTFELLAAAEPGTRARPTAPHLLVASRPLPGLNLSRAELAHTVVVGPDDLRLRWWEVDRLFTEVHGRPADPVLAWDATWLTGGWAAPLHEFLLCVRDLSPRQARRTLTAPGAPFAAGYLDRQILDELAPDLRVFLMRIAIHTEPTAADCAVADTPAARAAAEALLRRAVRAGVLVRRGAAYVGEPLLRHLLVHRLATTSPDARKVFEPAMRRMRAASDPVGAAWAAFLAHDRAALRDIMDRNPVLIAAALPDHWHELLRTFAGPARPTDRHTARDRTGDRGVPTGPGDTPDPKPRAHVLTGIVDMPLRLADIPDLPGGPEGALVHAATLMGTGDFRAATEAFDACLRDHDGPPAAAARLFTVLCALLSGHGCDVRDVESAAQHMARTGPAWLARVARAGLTLTGAPEYRDEATAVRTACERLGDIWGAAIAGHMDACASLLRGEPDPDALAASARRFAAAGMTAAAPWARAFEALARAQLGEAGAAELARRAEAEAADWELPGAVVIARCAGLLAAPQPPRPQSTGSATLEIRAAQGRSAAADRETAGLPGTSPGMSPEVSPETAHAGPGPAAGGSASDYDSLTREAERLGIRTATFLRRRRSAEAQVTPVDIRCFGGFTVRLAGNPLDLLRLAPQSRVLFRLLALHAGRPVHREVLAAALWPDAPADAAFHRLQTAVYKLRRFLEPERGRRGASEFVPFEDGAYRLRLPAGSYLDIATAEDALSRARRAAARGDAAGETRALRELLAVVDAVLLPETGPEEWVVEPRERWSGVAAEARTRLAARPPLG
jgi:hypothetical protein